MRLNSICREIADVIQEYTINGGYRPFGVSMLVAGYDEEGPHLFQIDPYGSVLSWKATALG
jgi:20S proteasome subunit alpha 2